MRRARWTDITSFCLPEVEIEVRRSGGYRSGGYSEDDVSVSPMRRAFNPEGGPLADNTRVNAEQQGMSARQPIV